MSSVSLCEKDCCFIEDRASMSRRSFLKLAGLFGMGLAIPQVNHQGLNQVDQPDNLLIVVFDAFSAQNTPIYGYPRNTTPNLVSLAERAIIYHNHIATGNFTTPGTASLLTGTYPWTHRAFTLHETVDDSFSNKSIFHAFPHHYRLAYTHNPFADILLEQFKEDINQRIPIEELFILFDNKSVDALFKRDRDTSNVAWLRAFEKNPDGYAYSLFLSHFYKELIDRYRSRRLESISPDYPRGVPGVENRYFSFEESTNYLIDSISKTPQPFVSYFHFYPPHAPYTTHRDFTDRFAEDGYHPIVKPEHIFSTGTTYKVMAENRRDYDEYLLHVDREFGRLYESLKRSGLLDNTWVVLTSDHGEMFERGIIKHTTLAMSQPVVHVPLMIFGPQIDSRVDIYQSTNAIDVLPTLTSMIGQEIPDWCEGIVMPPFQVTDADKGRAHYSMNLTENAKYGHLKNGSIALVKDPYKLTYYYGYNELSRMDGEAFELYDLNEDPEELNNLYYVEKSLAQNLQGELMSQLVEVNKLYN